MASIDAADLASVVTGEIKKARGDLDAEIPAGMSVPLLSAPDGSKAAPETQAFCSPKRYIIFGIVICFIFMALEIVGGYLSHSLALLADAAHMLTDVAGLSISLASMVAAEQPGTHHYTFGYRRVEVIGALGSILLIWILTGAVLAEAVRRVQHPEDVDGFLMTIIGGIGVVFNIVMALVMSVGGMGHTHSHGMGGAGECSHGHSHDSGDHGHSHSSSDHGHSHSSHVKSADEAEHGHSHAGGSCSSEPAKHSHSHGAGDSCSGEHGHGHGHGHDDVDDDGGHHHGDHEVAGSPTACDCLLGIMGCGSSSQNLNVRAALAHAIGDLAQNVAVCIAGGLIWYNPDWHLADPICTFIFSLIVVGTTMGAMRDIVNVLLEGVPARVDYHSVLRDLGAIKGVTSVHNLHIWSTSGQDAHIAVHLVVRIDSETGRGGGKVAPSHSLSSFLRDDELDNGTVDFKSEAGYPVEGGNGEFLVPGHGTSREQVGDLYCMTLRRAMEVCEKHKIDHSTVQVEVLGSGDVAACQRSCKTIELKNCDTPDCRSLTGSVVTTGSESIDGGVGNGALRRNMPAYHGHSHASHHAGEEAGHHGHSHSSHHAGEEAGHHGHSHASHHAGEEAGHHGHSHASHHAGEEAGHHGHSHASHHAGEEAGHHGHSHASHHAGEEAGHHGHSHASHHT